MNGFEPLFSGGLALVGLLAVMFLALGFNTGYIPGPLDAKLRLEDGVTQTADFAGTALDLGEGYAPGGPGQRFSVVLDVTALDLADENETYAYVVRESANGEDWTNISPVVAVTATGAKGIPIFVSQRYVRVELDVAGTTPSVTYSAWLVPHQ